MEGQRVEERDGFVQTINSKSIVIIDKQREPIIFHIFLIFFFFIKRHMR